MPTITGMQPYYAITWNVITN